MRKNPIVLSEVSLQIGSKKLLHEIDLEVIGGETLGVIGPSGSGKTSLLNIISGLWEPTAGKACIYGKEASKYQSRDRRVSSVFQGRTLFPSKTVKENIAFGPIVRGVAKSESYRRAIELANILDIEDLLERSITNLSGGEYQRTSIARALAVRPDILLLDEPMTGLDNIIRRRLLLELKHIQQERNLTYVHVGHDIEEVFSLADRVVALDDGAVDQIGTPEELRHHPSSQSVAELVGYLNVLKGEVLSSAGLGDHKISVGRGHSVNVRAGNASFGPSESVAILVSPNAISIVDESKAELVGELSHIDVEEATDICWFRLWAGMYLRMFDHSRVVRTRVKIGEQVGMIWQNATLVAASVPREDGK